MMLLDHCIYCTAAVLFFFLLTLLHKGIIPTTQSRQNPTLSSACVRACAACVRACVRTVPYNLPLLFIATNIPLFTPNRLITPRSTAEISSRP